MWWYPHHDVGWEWMLGMGLVMVLFWGGLILFGIWIVRSLAGGPPPHHREEGGLPVPPPPRPDPLEIAKERYARGEITRAEYEQIRDDLRT